MADKKISEETVLTKDGTERIPVIQSDGSGGWINGSLPITDFGGENLGNADLTLSDDRTLDGDGKYLFMQSLSDFGVSSNDGMFFEALNAINTKVLNAPTPGVSSMFLEFNGSLDSEILVNLFNQIDDVIRIYGTGKTSIKESLIIGVNTPESDSSVLFNVTSTTKGSLPFPRMTEAEIEAIPSPADGLMVHNTDIGYPQIYHPTYGWQSIGYGEIRLTIDFSVTPLNPTNSYKLEIPTSIPIGKIIHKIIIAGNGVTDPVDDFSFGLYSDTSYFLSSPSVFNTQSGDVSTGNSKRTTELNEIFYIESLDGSLIIDSGTLDITILHT